MRPVIMFPGLAILCAGLGWLAADREEPKSQPGIGIAMQGKSAERLPAVRGRAVPAEIEGRLRTLRAATTPEDRLRAMTELANSIPVSELAAWYEAGWIERRETMESLQFYHITRQRWLAEDGAGMMDHYLKKDRAGVSDLALDWGKLDPAAAFGFGDALTDEADRSTLMGSIAAATSEVHPEIALKALARYNPPRSGTSWGTNSIIEGVAKADPELLRREIANLPANLARGAKQALARERLKTDFAAGVAAFAVEEDGKQQFISAIQSSMELTKQMLERPGDLPEGWLADLLAGNNVSLVGRDPKRWLELDLESLGLPEERVKAVQNYALGRTLYSHPERLHEILSADNLSPEARNQAIRSAVARLGAHDRAKAADLIAQLVDPAEKAFAQARLDETPEREEMPFLRTPEELGKLAALKGNVDVTNVMSGWGQDEMRRAAVVFEKLPPTDKDALAMKLTGYTWADLCMPLRAAAYDHLLRGPAPQTGEAKVRRDRVYAFASVYGMQDPGAASRWVESLPVGEARIWAAKNVAASWAEYYPAESRKWVEGLDFRAEVEAAKVKEE